MHLRAASRAASRAVLASRVETNTATVCTLLDEHPEADLAVLPELFPGPLSVSAVREAGRG